MKAGKTADLERCVTECLKSSGEIFVDQLVKLLNVCFLSNTVPRVCQSACKVPLYKVNNDKYNSTRYRGYKAIKYCILGVWQSVNKGTPSAQG